MSVLTIRTHSTQEADAAARSAAEAMRGGGVVVVPTETVYGVAALANDLTAVARLRAITSAPDSAPLTLHLPSLDSIELLLGGLPGALRRLVRKALPGPLSLVIQIPPADFSLRAQAMSLSPKASAALLDGGFVRIRVPDDAVARRVLQSVGGLVVAVSGRDRDGRPVVDGDDAAQVYGDSAALVINAGRTRFAKPSTVVRAVGRGKQVALKVERAGVLDERVVHRMARWTMLLVCSGNTCRSPMAEGIARQILAEERGVAPDELEAAGLRVISAGAFASAGSPASRDAVDLMRAMGIDISHHRSRPVTRELIQEADVVFCMTDSHREAVLEIDPSAEGKVRLLDENGDVEDPIGAGAAAYNRSAEQIRGALERRLKEEQP